MSKFTKQLGVGALAIALIAAPAFALANNKDDKRMFAPRSVGSTLEVSIGDNGKTVVRGAKVTDVSGSTITAQTIWDASSITWTVRTDGDTDFIKKNGSASSAADINDGDYISFSGTLVSGSSFTVDADVVKNWSLAENRTAVAGSITSISGDEFVVATKGRGNVTVETNNATTFSGTIDSFGDLATNTRVVAYGTYNPETRVLLATDVAVQVKVNKDKDNREHGWGQLLKNLKFDFWNHKK